MNTIVRDYKYGDVVKILKVPDKYVGVLNVGDIGNVKCVIKYMGEVRNVHITIHGKKNRFCKDGHFCMNTYYLERLNNKGEVMNMQELLKGYEIATVRFRDFKGECKDVQYALYDGSIVPHDFVLCMTERNEEVVGKVMLIEQYKEDIVQFNRQIICKVDYNDYNKRLEKVKRIKELKLKMAKKKEELNELAVYQALAANSPEMAEMLKELKELI